MESRILLVISEMGPEKSHLLNSNKQSDGAYQASWSIIRRFFLRVCRDKNTSGHRYLRKPEIPKIPQENCQTQFINLCKTSIKIFEFEQTI
jgi:hypothetical protein